MKKFEVGDLIKQDAHLHEYCWHKKKKIVYGIVVSTPTQPRCDKEWSKCFQVRWLTKREQQYESCAQTKYHCSVFPDDIELCE